MTVAKTKNFAKAARCMRVSSPVLTKQIQRLEQHVGKQLFHRTTRNVSLTEAGEVYFSYAKIIIAEEKEALTALSNIETEPHGTITLGLSTKLNCDFIGKSLAEFLARYPKIKCRLISQNAPSAVTERTADIVLSPLKITDSRLVIERLFTAPTGLFASPNYIKKHGMPRSLQDLKKHNCLINLNVSPDGIWKFEQGKKIQITGNYGSTTGSDILIGALNGIGIAYVARFLVKEEIVNKELIEITLDYNPEPLSIYIYFRPVSHCNIVRLLADHLLKTVAF